VVDPPNYRFSQWTEKILLFLSVVAIYGLYIPVAKIGMNSNPIELTTDFDRVVPYVPEWIFVYVAIYFAAILPVFVVKERHYFRRIALAYLIVETIAVSSFLLVPVQMVLRPELVPDGSLINWGMMLCYYADLPVNCFPSLHVAIAVLGALACLKVDRVVGSISSIIALLIIASTMLIKQHYVADVIAGLVLASTTYYLVLKPAKTDEIPSGELRYSRLPSVFVLMAYGILIASLYVAYLSGWAPWEGQL